VNTLSPTDALDQAISAGLLLSIRRGPGGVVQAMSKETRSALSQLTSDMLTKVRVPDYVCRVGGRRGRARL